MNAAYVYLQIYRLFDGITPLKKDCGMLCGGRCCKDDGTGESGMYLFPGEKEVYKLLSPDWLKVEKSEFTYTSDGKEHNVPIAICSGTCDRFERPLACRIFPLTPHPDGKGNIEIIVDPRAKKLCPLARNFELSDFESEFVDNVGKAFRLLMKNRHVRDFMTAYGEYLDEFGRFF